MVAKLLSPLQMLETEGGDDFDSDDNDHLRYPIQGHWTALSIPDGCQMLETKDGDDFHGSNSCLLGCSGDSRDGQT